MRFFIVATAVVSFAAEAQVVEPSKNDPAIGGIVRDSSGTPVPETEVAIVRNGRLQQFMVTGADGKFLLTGVAAAVVPLRVRRVGYTMQSFDVDTRLPASKTLEVVLAQSLRSWKR